MVIFRRINLMKNLIVYGISLLLSASLFSVRADSCYLFDRGFGAEQWTSIRANTTHTIITMGEVPVRYPGVGFINAPVSCVKDGIFKSSYCSSSIALDTLLTDGSSIIFGTVIDTINNGTGNISSSGVTVVNLASGVRYIMPSLQWTNDSWIVFIIGLAPVGSLTKYKIVSYTGDYYIYARPLSSLVATNPNLCDGFDYFVSMSRWTVYNNLKYMRYGVLMFIGVIALILAYKYWYTTVMLERRFATTIGISLIMTYTATGFYFTYFNMDFSGIEYAYYVAMSILYFSSFVRYVFKKYIQERSFSFYNEIYSGDNYKLEETNAKIRRNNRLDELLNAIPEEYSQSLILWIIIVVAMAPMIQLLIPSASYSSQIIVTSIVKFVVSIVAVLLPATVVLIWSLIRFKRTEADISFYKVLKRFFGMYDDPLIYRTEFVMALIICLPLAIITFIIGNLDPLIPNYILVRRIVQLAFHAAMYTAFDVSFALLITGFYAIIFWVTRTRNIDIHFAETTSVTSETRRLEIRDLVLAYALADTEGREIIIVFSNSIGGYHNYGNYKFMEDLSLKLQDPTTPELINFFFKSMLKDMEYRMLASRHGLIGTDGLYDPKSILSRDLGLIITDVMDIAAGRLFAHITQQGILRVKEFYLYCDEKEEDIKAYLLLKRKKLDTLNLEELDHNDEEALERQNSDDASYAYDLSEEAPKHEN